MSTDSRSSLDPATGERPRRRFPLRFLVYGAMVAAVLAVAIPSLLRARISSGESPHIGIIRTMISAQAAYQSANDGFYDHPRCLVDPQRCIPGYPAGAPTFIDATMLRDARYGYRWTFHPGPPAPSEAIRAGRSSPSSLGAFAYVAVPIEWGRTGLRGFCGDATGLICYTVDGVTPPVQGGACAREPRCRPL